MRKIPDMTGLIRKGPMPSETAEQVMEGGLVRKGHARPIPSSAWLDRRHRIAIPSNAHERVRAEAKLFGRSEEDIADEALSIGLAEIEARRQSGDDRS